MGEVTVILTSPEGTALTVYDGNHPGQANFNGNLGWDNPINGGDLYSFYGEDTVGTWTLQVIDNVPSNTGTLDGWTMHFNEDWDGELFVGENITVQEEVHVRGKMYVEYGAELIFLNTDGEETFKIASEDGKVSINGSGGGSIIDNEEFIPQVFWVSSSEYSGGGGWGSTVTASCPANTAIISGSCQVLGGSLNNGFNGYNTQSGESWLCQGYNYNSTTVTYKARALCMNTAP